MKGLIEQRRGVSAWEVGEIMDALPVGIAFSTPGTKEKILEANSTLIRIFGYDSKEEFLKQPASAYFFDPEERKRFSELRKKGPVKNYETRFKRKDGNIFWGSVSSIPRRTRDNKLLFINVVEDITEHKRSEERIRRHRDELQARAQIIKAILKTFDLDERLKVILDELMKFLDMEMGAVHLAAANDLVLRTSKGIPDRMLAHLAALPVEGKKYMPEKARVILEKHEEKGEMFDFAKREGIQTLVLLPIRTEIASPGEKKTEISRLGTIMLASRRYGALSSEELSAIEAMADKLALAIDHSFSFYNARQRLVRLEVLREIDRAILSRLHVKEILKIVTASVPKEIGGDAIAVSLLDGENSKTKVFTIRYPNGTIIEEEAFSMADSLLHWYTDRKEPVIIYDIARDPRIQMHSLLLRKHKLISYLGVPLVAEGKTLGILHVLTCQPKVFFAEDVRFFQTLGGQVSVALRSAQLFEQLRQSEQKFHKMAASAHDAIILIDHEGKISFWNKGAKRIFGYSTQEALGKDFIRLVVPSRFKESFRLGYAQFQKTGRAPLAGKVLEMSALREDGKEFPIELSISALKLNNRWHSLEIIRDISKRKEIEKKLRIRHLAMESSITPVVLADLKGRISYVNPAFAELWDYKEIKEILGKSVLDFWQQKEEAEKAVRELKTSGRWAGDLAARRKDGSVFHVRGGASLIKDESNMPILMVASFVDVTPLTQKKEELRQSIARLKGTFMETIHSLATAIETRDAYTAGHQRRVAQLACAIAQDMGFSEERLEGLMMAGLSHDVGKISVPTEILTKTSKLMEAEISIIRNHPEVGYDILKNVDFPWPVALTVLQHHERINGSGYPQGLSGKDTLLEAKILAVADVVEAMSSHRPYRPAHELEVALEEISKGKNTLYEAEIVDACIRLFRTKKFRFE